MYGNRTRLKVIQNKVAPPFREVGVESLYGEGLSKCGELVDLAVKHDIIQRSGACSLWVKPESVRAKRQPSGSSRTIPN